MDLCLIARGLANPLGENSLQVTTRYRTLSRFATFLLFGSAVFVTVAGCHRSPSGDVVATVNGKEISRAELQRIYQIDMGNNPQQPSPEEADIRRLNELHQMIQDEILQQRAAKMNLTASDEDVNARLTEIKSPYTQDQFFNILKQRNQTLDDLKRDIRHDLTRTKLLNKEIESKINITDAQISAFYTAHKAEFDLIEPQYHLAQIVVSSVRQSSANNMPNKASGEAEARKKIETAHNQLESGQDFSTVAANLSENPTTASMGGDMGFVPESQLRTDPIVYDAVNKLKPNQFTGIFPIYDAGHKVAGYAIYKLLSREPAGQRELNDPRVQQAIHQTLHDSQKQLLQAAYIEMLQNEARVHNYLAEQILKRGGQ
jgi:peptidyl-prolyl cis-trans isomerase SurA